MTEKSNYRIYIDTTDRKLSKITLFRIDENGETEISKKEGQFDIVSSIRDMLSDSNLSIADIKTFDYNRGPGSFTGLRIGATVANVLNWVLGRKKSDELDYPVYGKEPNITPPKGK